MSAVNLVDPVASLRRSLTLILLLQISASLLTLVTGACVLSHVAPRSQCLLFSRKGKIIHSETFTFFLIFRSTDGPSLSYGPYYFCELLGSGHILCFLLMLITVIVNLRQIKNVVKTSNLTVLKSWKCLKVKQMTVALQWINFSVILILSVILTASFRASCDAFRVFVEEKIDKKLNVDLTRLRGETIDERFVDDPFFWRYTRRVTNSFGAEMFSTVTSCRLMMTDPEIVTILHDNHADKFAGKPDAVTHNVRFYHYYIIVPLSFKVTTVTGMARTCFLSILPSRP